MIKTWARIKEVKIVTLTLDPATPPWYGCLCFDYPRILGTKDCWGRNLYYSHIHQLSCLSIVLWPEKKKLQKLSIEVLDSSVITGVLDSSVGIGVLDSSVFTGVLDSSAVTGVLSSSVGMGCWIALSLQVCWIALLLQGCWVAL